MSEFIVFSDPHYHKNYKKSYILENGISSWLQTQVDITDSIFAYAETNNIYTVIINGDFFETKNYISSSLYNFMWKLFKKYSEKFNIILNTGNHDIFKQDRNSSLTPFSDIINVITQPIELTFDDTKVKFIPYGMTKDELKSDADILFLHEEIEGIINFKSEKLIRLKDILDYKLVFNGHIHSPKDIHNIINIGSILPQDWGEAKDRKRFIHYKDGKVTSVPIKHPKWNILDSIPDDINNYDFYRINISPDELKDPVFKLYNVFPNITKSTKRKNRIERTNNINDEIIQYIELMDSDLNTDRLFKIAKELLI